MIAGMGYLNFINAFWLRQEEFELKSLDVALYFYLLNWNNRLNWDLNFKRSNQKVMSDLGCSFKTLQVSRDRLKAAGLIDFKTSNGVGNVTYSITANLCKNSKGLGGGSGRGSGGGLDEVRAEINKSKSKTIKSTTNVVPKKSEKPIFSLDFIDDENFKKLFEDWLDYKRRVKHNSYKDQKQIELAYRKMYELGSGDIETCRAIVEQSIANNWQGLFELKTQSFNNQKTNTKNEQNKQSGAALGRVATSDQHRAISL